MIQAGGVSLNKERLEELKTLVGEDSFLDGKYLLAQKGKKNYFIIKIPES